MATSSGATPKLSANCAGVSHWWKSDELRSCRWSMYVASAASRSGERLSCSSRCGIAMVSATTPRSLTCLTSGRVLPASAMRSASSMFSWIVCDGWPVGIAWAETASTKVDSARQACLRMRFMTNPSSGSWWTTYLLGIPTHRTASPHVRKASGKGSSFGSINLFDSVQQLHLRHGSSWIHCCKPLLTLTCGAARAPH